MWWVYSCHTSPIYTMTLDDLTDEVLDIVNRKNASAVYRTYATRAVEAALIKLYQKLNFEVFRNIQVFDTDNTKFDYKDIYKQINSVTDSYGKTWRISSGAAIQQDLLLKRPKSFPMYTAMKFGTVLYFPVDMKIQIDGYLTLTQARNQEDFFANEFLPNVRDYVVFEAVDRIWRMIHEDVEDIQLNRSSRDSAYLDIEKWNAGYIQTGTVEVYG